MGSLAAGASAVMGTGAITESSFNRDVTGRVVNDKNGYVQVHPDGSGDPVAYNNGEVALDFGDLGPNDGDGLNSDSLNYFDNLIEVRVMPEDAGSRQAGNTPYYLWFTSPHGRLTFYFDGTRNSLMGAGNAKAMVARDGNGNTINSGNVAFYRLIAGLKIDLEDAPIGPGESLDNLFGGEENFRIHVQQGDPSP
jgi:hypothetical protein